MNLKLSVHYLPQFIAESELADGTVIVVDLLRASTTICDALQAGAKCVIPVLEVSEAVRRAESLGREHVVLGGERGGKPIAGFDLGNSPVDYVPEQVFARAVVFTTTNGTRALHHARLARRVLVGAAVNQSAIARAVQADEQVAILCAGTRGSVTREDVLAAGGLAEAIQNQHSAGTVCLNEWAEAALGEWQELSSLARACGRSLADQLAIELRSTPGGRNLLAIGYDEDLRRCAELDVLDVVPTWDARTGEITLR